MHKTEWLLLNNLGPISLWETHNDTLIQSLLELATLEAGMCHEEIC